MIDRPPLSRAAYDRAAARRTDPGWLERAWPKARVVAVTPKSATPISTRADGSVRLVLRTPVSVPDSAPRRFLGVVDDVPYFAATVESDDAHDWLTLREFGAQADDLEAALLVS